MIYVPSKERLLIYGDPALTRASSLVLAEEFGSLELLRDYMRKVMTRFNAIGLAAPQVGIPKQYISMFRADGSLLEMVNPEITRMYGVETNGFEACVSIPPAGNGCPVPRLETVEIEYCAPEDPKTFVTVRLHKYEARVAQHQIDHLSGTFFFDRASTARRRIILDELTQWKENRNAKDTPRPVASTRS